jgi:hypothetical protein
MTAAGAAPGAAPDDPRRGDNSLRVQVMLDEFKALRDEINDRATHCHTVININVVASGSVAAFALEDPSRLALLLLLPVLGPVLGLLWLDHSYAIRGIGDYINGYLRPEINELAAGDGRLLGWETFLDMHEKEHKLLRFLPLGLPISLIFAGVPALALGVAVSAVETVEGWALWGLGLALIFSFLTVWIRFLTIPWVGGRSTAFSGVGTRH